MILYFPIALMKSNFKATCAPRFDLINKPHNDHTTRTKSQMPYIHYEKPHHTQTKQTPLPINPPRSHNCQPSTKRSTNPNNRPTRPNNFNIIDHPPRIPTKMPQPIKTMKRKEKRRGKLNRHFRPQTHTSKSCDNAA